LLLQMGHLVVPWKAEALRNSSSSYKQIITVECLSYTICIIFTIYITTAIPVISPIRGHHSAPSHTMNRRAIRQIGDSQSATIVEGYGVRRESASKAFHPNKPSITIIRKAPSTGPIFLVLGSSILLYTEFLFIGRG